MKLNLGKSFSITLKPCEGKSLSQIMRKFSSAFAKCSTEAPPLDKGSFLQCKTEGRSSDQDGWRGESTDRWPGTQADLGCEL